MLSNDLPIHEGNIGIQPFALIAVLIPFHDRSSTSEFLTGPLGTCTTW